MPRFSVLLLVTAWVGAIFVACGTKELPPLCATPANPFTYGQNVKALYQQNCGCHDANVTNRQGAPTRVVLSDYNNAILYAAESRQTVLNGTMPPNSSLDFNTRCIVDAWFQGNLIP